MTLKELKHAIVTLAKKIEAVGAEAVAGIKTFDIAKGEMDAMEADLKKLQDEYSVVSRFEETKTANLAALGGLAPADANEGEKDAQQHAATKAMTFGEQWTNSQAYKNMVTNGFHGKWQSEPVELKVAGPLTEGTSGTPGSGYAFVQTPTVLPGITSVLFAGLTIADLIPSGVTDSPLLRYLIETAVTNAAATVAEAGDKPLSDITVSVVDERLRKIATLLDVTDEMLADYGQITSYLNGRLQLFVKIAEETQLLLGDGTGENLIGFMNRAGKTTTIVKGAAPSIAGDNNMDVILRQITAVRVGSFLEPDAIVIDPTAWQATQLLKAVAGTGDYFAGGPFMTSAVPTLWGKPVVVSLRMTPAAALVGAFQQASQLFRKGGIVIDASNSHNDNFGKDKTTLRAEERLMLAVYRPSAFGVVTGLSV